MSATISVPLWLFVLILLFAAVTFASHFLFPSVRWFFRRRMEKVVTRLNERLVRPIEPFKLARRHDMIQRLIYDPKVAEAIAAHAKNTGVREDVVFQEVQRYAREIVPSFSATAYFGFAIRLARWLARAFYRVRITQFDEDKIHAIAPDATIIYVMNHRSNMDYVLVTYLAGDHSALSYAVGEWARVWPLSVLIRAMGAYFIRRNSRSDLYRRVLARYVQMATAGGVTQAIFPEGGLSLDGRVGAAKLGLLSYIVEDFDPKVRDVVFVPVALNYDRVLEDRVLVSAKGTDKKRFRFSWWAACRYILKHLMQRLTGRFLRYGYAAVSFGTPVSLADFARGISGDPTKAIGQRLMESVRQNVPALPVPLVVRQLIAHEGPIPIPSLKADVAADVKRLSENGYQIRLPDNDPALAVDFAIRHLEMRRMVTVDGDDVAPTAGNEALMAYYANSIAHLFDATAAKDAAVAGS